MKLSIILACILLPLISRGAITQDEMDQKEEVMDERELLLRPATEQSLVFVAEVRPPGESFVPSTGRLLHVYELNEEVLRGHFVSNERVRIVFESRNDGSVRVKHSGSTFLHIVNLNGSVHFGEMSGRKFVFDDSFSHIFRLGPEDHNQRRRGSMIPHREKRALEEHWHRAKRSGHPTAESEFSTADLLLANHDYFRLLPLLSEALGEFGIVAKFSPSAKPIMMVGYDVGKRLKTGMNATSLDDVLEKANTKRKLQFNTEIELVREMGIGKSRPKRGWFRRAVRNVARVVKKVAKAVVKVVKVVRDVVSIPINIVRVGVTSLGNAIFQRCNRYNPGVLCYRRTTNAWTRTATCPGSNTHQCVCEPCPGLCGGGCGCGFNRILCGNCCKHRGCFEHDICCSIHGGIRHPVCFYSFLTGGARFSCSGGFDPYPNCHL